MFIYVPIKHEQMSLVSNGGKFKRYTVPNGLLFERMIPYYQLANIDSNFIVLYLAITGFISNIIFILSNKPMVW
jgi:hypothetical protein